MKHRHRTLASVLVVAVALAACGSDDGADVADTAVPATDAPAATEPSADDSADDGTEAADDEAAFPVTIEHKFGSTTIDAEPERVVSIGFAEHDGLLAIGVTPVAVRDWYGDQPFATWPWALDELGDAEPEVLPSAELNFEQIAALRPDVILGVGSGMTDSDYETLSAIAPTVAQPGEYVDYGTPWDVSLEIAGRATGRTAQAEEVVAATKALFADAIAAHPEFDGATASVAFFFQEQPGVYASEDVRSRALTDLGFVIPDAIDEAAGDSFFASVSPEDLSLLDTDVVVWIGTDAASFEAIAGLPTRPTTRAFLEGREVVADELLSAAFSHASPLSFEYVVETLVPELALAVDGDPATAVPSAASIAPGDGEAVPAADADDPATAVAAAWTLVFDSTVGFDDKAPHLEGAEELRSTIEAYTAAGAAMGGISLEPTAIEVDGDTATVTYDVLFGENVAYGDIAGAMTLVDGTWVVSRAEFCGFMASARNACPAG